MGRRNPAPVENGGLPMIHRDSTIQGDAGFLLSTVPCSTQFGCNAHPFADSVADLVPEPGDQQVLVHPWAGEGLGLHHVGLTKTGLPWGCDGRRTTTFLTWAIK